MNKVVNLISGPRNLSTAIMYSFAQRADFEVLDEPFYAFYLKNANVKVNHPAYDAILNTMEQQEEKIVAQINSLAIGKNVFVKGMAHHYLSKDPKYITQWENVILIRHPKKLIASFSKVIEKPTIDDIGVKKASELFLFLKENNRTPIVIDSDELLKAPSSYLKKLCGLLDLSYSEEMLSWNKGGIPQDGVWAPHWYKNVHNSEGFVLQKSSSEPLPERLSPLLQEALPYYETLREHILKND